jgi:DNA invertase Pin-like site-specific DNA recombinase
MKKQENIAKRVALYARVSTPDKGQDPETQLAQLRDYALRRNFEIIGEFIDYASGTTQDRVQYKLMMTAAKKRKLDVVLVWRYDGTGRPALCPLDPSPGQCPEGIPKYGN